MKPIIITILIILLMTLNIRKVTPIKRDTYLIEMNYDTNCNMSTGMGKIILDQQKTIRYYQLYCLVSSITFILSCYIAYNYLHQRKKEPVKIPEKSHVLITEESEIEFDSIYASILRYVVSDKHYLDKDIDIESVGKKCRIKKGEVNKILDAKANTRLLELVNSYRLEYACTLLLDKSNKTMDAIADESGFKTTRTFLRQFKSRYNMLPSEYRRSNIYNHTAEQNVECKTDSYA